MTSPPSRPSPTPRQGPRHPAPQPSGPPRQPGPPVGHDSPTRQLPTPDRASPGESATTPLTPLDRPVQPTRQLEVPPPVPGGGRPPGPPSGPTPPEPRSRRLKIAAAAAIAVALVVAGVLISTGGSSDPGPIEATPAPSPAPAPVPADCRYPAQVLDLTGWNITIPTPSDSTSEDEDDRDGAKEVSQPQLATFVQRPFFAPTESCDGVVFRAPVNGKTTDNSGYPRSELREMTADGRRTAGWSSSTGTHTLVVDEAFTALPQGRPNVVGAQIHDGEDDVSVFRLEGSELYVTKGDDSNYKLVTDSYVLGTRFEAKYVVDRDTIQAFYNGRLVATIPARFSGGYFKAGIYTQANCKDRSVPCAGSNFGETVVYSVKVEHS